MRTLYALAFAGLTFAAGCGGLGNTASTSAANSSDVSDSANESADIAASFAQESSGITAYALNMAKPDLTPTQRAELVVALETIAADPTSCVSGSASVTDAGQVVANCSNIGTNGSYSGGATLTFKQCALRNGGILDGSAAVAVTRTLSAGETCGPSANVDVTHTITMTNLSYTSSSKYVLSYPTFSATVASTHAIDAAPTLLTLSSLNGERTIHGPLGTLLLDHQLSGSGTVQLAAGSRTLNGSFTVVHEILKFTAQAVLTNVERVETCCKPISGTIGITLTSNVNPDDAVAGTFSYGPACGDIDFNGKLIAIAECL